MDSPRHRILPLILLLLVLVGCTKQQNPQQLKEETARATEEMKRDARAVASGIREGWSRDKPLDLNSASKDQLVTLPGLTSAEADRVIAARPYHQVSDLLTRRVLRKSEYDKIADLVKVKK
jgi:DNA uptake protein ComE-like DNA-binding protein